MDRFYDYAHEKSFRREDASYLDKIVKEFRVPSEQNQKYKPQPDNFTEKCRRFFTYIVKR